MPSIEIICVDQVEPINFSDMPFNVTASTELISKQRSTTTSPLFQQDFDALEGCLYRLEVSDNPSSSSLLTQWWKILHFKPENVPHIKRVLEELLEASPARKVVFSSNYPSGPEAKRVKRAIKLERFWLLHDSEQLATNALYTING